MPTETLTPAHRSSPLPPPRRAVPGAHGQRRGGPEQNGKYAAPVMTLAKKIGIPVVSSTSDGGFAPGYRRSRRWHGSDRAAVALREVLAGAENVLDAVRDGACECVAELVTAEAARRERRSRRRGGGGEQGQDEAAQGNIERRGRGGRGDDKDDDEDDDEDDEDEDDEDDDDDARRVNEARDQREFDQSEGPNAAASMAPKGTAKKRKDARDRRRDILNRPPTWCTRTT